MLHLHDEQARCLHSRGSLEHIVYRFPSAVHKDNRQYWTMYQVTLKDSLMACAVTFS